MFFELIKQFFSVENLFTFRPPPITPRFLKFLLLIFGGFLITSIFLKLMMKQKEKDRLVLKASQKFFHLFLTMGFIGLVYTFLAYEGAPYLSMKFLLIIWFIITVIWIGVNLKYLLVTVPKIKKEIQQRKDFEKYLP